MAAVHIRRGKMHELSTVGPIDHQRPKIHKPFPKSLIGTRSRFDPLEFDPGPSGRVAYDFHAETGEAGRGADLDRRIVLKTDPQGAGWNGRRTERGSAQSRGVPLSLPLRRSRWLASIGLKLEDGSRSRRHDLEIMADYT